MVRRTGPALAGAAAGAVSCAAAGPRVAAARLRVGIINWKNLEFMGKN
jgi:hypothetical protein